MLSTKSMIQIMDYYAGEFHGKKINGEYEWKLCYPFLQLIQDTGGLPRALQHLVEICFRDVNKNGFDFFRDIHGQYYQTIFSKTIATLDGLYNIEKQYETICT